MSLNESRTRWRRRILIALGVVAAGALLYLGFRPQPLLIDSAEVERGALRVTVENDGRTRVTDRYVISAPIAAHARRPTLEVGDPVAGGDVVVTLEPIAAPALDARARAEARARVSAAEGALAAARESADAAAATARLAAAEFTRFERLGQRGLIAPDEVDRVRTEAQRSEAVRRSAEFQVATARAELEAARAVLTYEGIDGNSEQVLHVRTPVAGHVLRRHLESAQVVQAGQALMEIGDPASLEIEVDVLSSDAVRIETGMRVIIERWGEPQPLEGRVRRVDPTGFTKVSALGVEEQRVWVIVDFRSPRSQWARLGDAYRVNARFVIWEGEDVLRVPASAVFRAGDGEAVFVVTEGRARLRPVDTGRSGGLATQVIEGLAEGERVIVHPDRDLTDGARVRERSR